MATHKSAEKRNRQNKKKNLRNRTAKATMKSAIKVLKDATASEKKENVAAKLTAAQKLIAQAARKGVVHKKTSARYISRLASLVNKSSN